MIDRETLIARLSERAAAGDALCADAASELRSAARCGRPRLDDDLYVLEMEVRLADGTASTVGEAARLVGMTLTDDHRELESAIRRLRRKFDERTKLKSTEVVW